VFVILQTLVLRKYLIEPAEVDANKVKSADKGDH
jgi:hypothetical protein